MEKQSDFKHAVAARHVLS